MQKRRIIEPFLVLLMIPTLLIGCDNRPNKQRDIYNTAYTLNIGATGQSYPNSFIQDGQLTGFDVEVTEAIADELGYTVNWKTGEFSGLMAQLESGRLDSVANAVAITNERAEKFAFTTPYSIYGSQIVTNIKNSDINKLDDLRGKTVSGVLGSNHIAILKKAFPKNQINIRTYETRDGAMYDLVYNRVDGYINAKPILLTEINRQQLPFKLVGEPLAIEYVAFPFNKNDQGDQLRNQFNQAIEKLQKNGAISQIAVKYYGQDISKP
ncbi:amino acid ABC transporter substrate-binding protein [Orbaceae bacterium ESL0721]|nr:amino acid ABC transporter substrate-binding protein [Orbaceae bacterium ESL0721]